MNIPSLPAASISSLAGSDRAASVSVGQASASERASLNVASNAKFGENVDSIDKGHASGDKDADGRQLLDTFERQNQDNEEQNDEAKKSTEVSEPLKAIEDIRPHIDFNF